MYFLQNFHNNEYSHNIYSSNNFFTKTAATRHRSSFILVLCKTVIFTRMAFHTKYITNC
uniref:Uncharacterized protein n=1 Tax=Arundo donax TaxID=35708 RepID=A0A0A9FFB4_ARUDO